MGLAEERSLDWSLGLMLDSRVPGLNPTDEVAKKSTLLGSQ
jgi:hypothetical protein